MKQSLYKYITLVVLLISATFANASPLYHFKVANTGSISALVAPSSAGYENHLFLVVNGVTSEKFINNHTDSIWSEINFGTFQAGSIVEFKVDVKNTNNTWWSDPLKNIDHMPHMQTLATLEKDFIYTGFEDLTWDKGDMDFNDVGAYWKNIEITTAVPEPPVVLMMLLGLGLLPLIKRKNIG